MALLRAFSNRLGGFRAVPRGAVTIDRSHPLASSLIAAYLPGLHYGRNLALSGEPADLAIGSANGVGAPVVSMTAEGPGYKTPTDDRDGLKVLAPASFKDVSKGFSYYWRGQYTSNAANAELICTELQSAEVSPFSTCQIFLVTSGNLELSWSEGATAKFSTSTPITAGLHSVAATFKWGDNARLYLDSQIKITSAMAVTLPTTTATTTFCITSGTYSGTRAFVQTTNLVLVWNRQLSAAEIALLDPNPYALFIPDDNIMPTAFLDSLRYPFPMFFQPIVAQ